MVLVGRWKREAPATLSPPTPTLEPMEVTLNPQAEKAWRRVLLAMLIEAEKPKMLVNEGKKGSGAATEKKESGGAQEKPLSKTATKKKLAEERAIQKARDRLAFAEFKAFVQQVGGELQKQLNRRERQTIPELMELVQLKNLKVPAVPGKPQLIMTLMEQDCWKKMAEETRICQNSADGNGSSGSSLSPSG